MPLRGCGWRNIKLGVGQDLSSLRFLFVEKLNECNVREVVDNGILCENYYWNRNKFNRLHLCTVSPWKFENGRRKEAHKELLSDLSQLESVLYIDSNDYLKKPGQQDTVFMGELMRQLSDDYAALLPRILNGIQDMEEKSYFDLASKSYVPVGAGFEQIDLTKASDEVSTVNVPLYRQWCTLGYAMPQKKYPMEDDGTKEETERVHARIDGKKICMDSGYIPCGTRSVYVLSFFRCGRQMQKNASAADS